MEKPRGFKDICRQILKKKNVVGVGMGFKEIKGRTTDELSIIALVRKKQPLEVLNKTDRIPASYNSFYTDVQEAGDIRLLFKTEEAEEESRTGRSRPAMAGISIGHYLSTAGTLGGVVRDNITGQMMILSNNHVLANVSDGRDGRSFRGDPIYQPGPVDGGTDRDLIARLERFIPLSKEETTPSCPRALAFGRLLNFLPLVRKRGYRVQLMKLNEEGNLVDAALGSPVEADSLNLEILGLGLVTGVARAVVGETLYKSGRTSGVTFGRVKILEASVWVNVSLTSRSLMHEQIITEAIAKPGDSGSLVLNSQNQAVGLLMAGSELVTISNNIENVETLLDIRVKPI